MEFIALFKKYGYLAKYFDFRKNSCLFSIFFLIISCSGVVFADDHEEAEALAELYGDEEMISLAIGMEQPISKAPAVATVITAKQIREMGASDLDEILETVPGLHVSRRERSGSPLYIFRGIYSGTNPQVLVLVNSIPITDAFLGDRNQIWGGMPVESISRVEIIRGPGSAIYGADAFAGVINVVTKTASEIDGTEVGVRYGTFNTKEGWLLHGGTYGGIDFAFMAEVKSTDGHSERIDSDFQSFSDGLTGSSASLAPGATNNNRDNLDLRLDAQKDYWTLRAAMQQRDNYEPGIGTAGALDDNVEYESTRWSADLTFDDESFTDDWGVQAQLSYFSSSYEIDEDQLVFPPNAFLLLPPPNAPLGPFPDGVIGNPEYWVETWRYSLTGLNTSFDDHLIRIGVGYTDQEFTRVREEQNFSPLAPPGTLVDVTDTAFVYLPERHRDNKYGFIQDVWSFANDWELTAGIRYDDYNDFGDTWNPRAALVWSARHDTTLKLLYGQAFRAPSFAEFRNQNNPVALGNNELDPEEIETVEFALDHRPNEDLRFGANVFYYEWSDIILFVADSTGASTAQNTGEQTGYGVELEMEWEPSNNFSLIANYAFQNSEDEETGDDSGNAPHHQIYARANWEFLPEWELTPSINYVIDRDRGPGDSREKLDDYMVVDLNLRTKVIDDKWELAIGVRNLFNSSPEEPTDASLNIANDLPLERRSIFAEIRLNLQ
tara:strand:+ start:15823 stop:17982 length:2160 start_codon:yes stop_codon:yes gene_type:complete